MERLEYWKGLKPISFIINSFSCLCPYCPSILSCLQIPKFLIKSQKKLVRNEISEFTEHLINALVSGDNCTHIWLFINILFCLVQISHILLKSK